MARPAGAPRSLRRLFGAYAAISLVAVLLLGVVLAWSYRGEAQRRGLAEGRAEASLIAQTVIEPQLDGDVLVRGLQPDETARLQRVVAGAIDDHDVLRLRLRDLSGQVVYSDDGSGFSDPLDDEALDAAAGQTVVHLSHLNADSHNRGNAGSAAVEVYLPLRAGVSTPILGVLEVYLPYAPINQDVTAELHRIYLDLTIGLGLLYLALFAMTASSTRRLRSGARLNAFLAEHDILTELPNRAWFHRHAALAAADGHGGQSVLAIIDLDHFKDVNDALGHRHGDQLLCALAGRLSGSVGPGDAVARLGGDEFGVVLVDAADPEAALWALRALIGRELEVSDLPVSVDCSIGYVVVPEDGTDVDDLLQRADVAMYVAKTHHSGVVRYDPSQHHYDATDLTLIGELRHAIAADQLVLQYQPQTSLDTGAVVSVEALVRWDHPTLGLLHPDRFIPLAEQTDLIDTLTAWVLTNALTQLRGLGPAWAGVAVAVNVSGRSLNRMQFADQVAEVLRRVDVSPDRLILEITETALLTEPERTAAILAQLAATGVKASIDDFGQGQTSLGYLSELPVHELKIDKSFVVDMATNPAHAAIARSIVDLGHNLALQVVAEGVETAEVLECLRRDGCDFAQGYHVARPMSIENLRGWLTVASTVVSRN